MWGEGAEPDESRDETLDPHSVYFVRTCSFEFEFHSLGQIQACLDHFSRKIQPTSRLPYKELPKYGGDHSEVQRWFDRLPMKLMDNHRRPKVVAAHSHDSEAGCRDLRPEGSVGDSDGRGETAVFSTRRRTIRHSCMYEVVRLRTRLRLLRMHRSTQAVVGNTATESMTTRPNHFVQATPVCAILFALGQVPGVPDDNRWPART